mmetsp:Transcript_16921/g.31587  ORF Transcript_16921/g.31587 Transcript_16921/m.31587 type:complete len:792 (-) Transcript_16921:100-2475(-)
MMNVGSAPEIEMLKQLVATLRQDLLQECQERRSDVQQLRDSVAQLTTSVAGDIQELPKVINSMKAAFDKEVHDRLVNTARVERHVRKFEELRTDLEARGDANKQELSQSLVNMQTNNEDLLKLVNAMKSNFDKEVVERTTNSVKIEKHVLKLEELRRDMEKQGDSQKQDCMRSLDDQKDATNELLRVVNSMKDAFDKEVSARLQNSAKLEKYMDKFNQMRTEIDEQANATKLENTRSLEVQRSASQELLGLVNNMKDSFDKEVHARLMQGVKLEKHSSEIENYKSSVDGRLEENHQAADELLRVMSHLKDTIDREQVTNIVKHKEVLKCIEDTHVAMQSFNVASGYDSGSLVRAQHSVGKALNNVGGSSALQEIPKVQAITSPQATIQSDASERNAQVPTPPVNEDGQKIIKKALEAVEQEKKDRTSNYGLLQSRMERFQYDFAVERTERTKLHSEFIALKAELMPQIKDLRQNLDSVERRALTNSTEAYNNREHKADGVSKQLWIEKEGSSANVLDNIKERVQAEVSELFSEYQSRQRELTDLIASLSTQEKQMREADISKLQHNLERLEKCIGEQDRELMRRMGECAQEHFDAFAQHQQRLRMISNQENVSREEFESQTRRLWEAVAPDGVTRAEFESNARRIWEAIMQLQSTQLEDMKQRARDAVYESMSDPRSSGPSAKSLPMAGPSRTSLQPALQAPPPALQAPPATPRTSLNGNLQMQSGQGSPYSANNYRAPSPSSGGMANSGGYLEGAYRRESPMRSYRGTLPTNPMSNRVVHMSGGSSPPHQ